MDPTVARYCWRSSTARALNDRLRLSAADATVFRTRSGRSCGNAGRMIRASDLRHSFCSRRCARSSGPSQNKFSRHLPRDHRLPDQSSHLCKCRHPQSQGPSIFGTMAPSTLVLPPWHILSPDHRRRGTGHLPHSSARADPAPRPCPGDVQVLPPQSLVSHSHLTAVAWSRGPGAQRRVPLHGRFFLSAVWPIPLTARGRRPWTSGSRLQRTK